MVRTFSLSGCSLTLEIKRIMKEAREKYDVGKMIAAYIRIYEKLNNGKPLA